jgi:hypothetical protein
VKERRRRPKLLARRSLPLLASALIVIGAVAVTLAIAHVGRNASASASGSRSGTSAGGPGSAPASALTSPMPKATDRAAAKKPASSQAPLRTNDCGPDPHLCGFPDATNTGVPAGMALAPVQPGSRGPGWSADSQGNVEVSGNGAVFAGYSVHGYVDVSGSNATVRDDSIVNYGTDINGDGVNLSGNPSNVTIEDVSISSPNGSSGDQGIFAGIKDINGEAMGTRVLDDNIADASTGVQIYIGLIQDNYIHDVTPAAPGSHLNGTTSNGSTVPLTIQHNTVFNPNGQTDAVSLFEDFGVEANVVINDNLLAGGGYTVYGGQNAGGPQAYNIKITNNRFSTIYFPQGGYYGYITAFNPSAPGNVWSGNVWDATGRAVSP